MKKKILALVLAIAMIAALCVGLAACNKDNLDGIKIGLICLHDENSTYDKNFIDAMYQAVDEMGMKREQLVIKKNIPEGSECYDAAVDLAEDGCNIIFADSFGHEDHMIRAAKEYPNVQFCHATGTKAHTENLANFHNAFASIYEGRYLAGIVAGYRLKEMIESQQITADQAKLGYVGAWAYAEVKSGYTSFYLGAKSVCPSVTMDVTFTNSWYDPTAEQNGAVKLMGRGCKVISQHADSMGAPNACQSANPKVPNVTYNVSTKAECADTYLVGSKINWAPYYKYIVDCVANGVAIDKDWTGTLATGSVQLLEYGNGVSQAAKDAVAAAEAKLKDGTLKVFDCSKFTVNGDHLTSYMADVNSDANFEKDTQVIENGIFKESAFRSAPYFDIDIDGITLLS